MYIRIHTHTHTQAAVDMEFEIADLNSDKKISLDEWKNVFFHEEPQVFVFPACFLFFPSIYSVYGIVSMI